MKNRQKFWFSALMIIAGLLTFVTENFAQLSPGQYLEEAPLGSWNNFGVDSAISVGAGARQVVLLGSNSSVLSNPALLTGLTGATLDLNFKFQHSQVYKFWMVNTGVISTRGNLSHIIYGLNYTGFNLSIKGWALAASFSQTENYGRPKIDYSYKIGSAVYEQMILVQKGNQTVYSFGLARQVNERLSIGFSLNLINGHLRRNFEDNFLVDGISIIDSRDLKITGIYFVLGAYYQLTRKLSLGLSLSPSYTRRFRGTSFSGFYSQETSVKIEIPGSGDDRIKMPLIAGAGLLYKANRSLNLSFEALFFNWKKYSFLYFGEPLERNFRNVLKLCSGLNHRSTFRFLGKEWEASYYAGIMFDPQPMTDVHSSYYYLTFGSGMGKTDFMLTLSTAIGFEKGSGNNLRNQKVCLSLQLKPSYLKRILTREKL